MSEWLKQSLALLDAKPQRLTIDLYLPPSINRNGVVFRLGNRAQKVQQWRRSCDYDLREQGLYGDRLHAGAISGVWGLDIIWTRDEWRNSDLDNRVKYLLDYLCSRELVEDDLFCGHMMVDWGYAPRGVRVHLYQWEVPDV